MERTLADFGELSPAEARLRDEIGLGKDVVFGTEVPPEYAGTEVTIRASFIRYLMLGGCDALPKPVPETGVAVMGARLTDTLNLQGATCARDLSLSFCRIEAAPNLLSAQLDGLFLNGAHLPGLRADGLRTREDVFLRAAEVTGEVRLLGARIGGDLDCDGATLTVASTGKALSCDRAEIGGNVVLDSATVTGEVRLLGARIGGNLDCDGATLTGASTDSALSGDGAEIGGTVVLRSATVTGEVRLLGARIGGNLECDGATLAAEGAARALNADGLNLTGSFFWRAGASASGVIDLTAARLGAIVDEEGCWPDPQNLVLNRCRYGAFLGKAPVTAEARIPWLDLQDPSQFGEDFWPQPWEQCAKVLREMGHGEEARKVLIAKEQRQRRARRAKAGPVWRRLLRLGDAFLWLTTSYGRRPLRAVWSLCAVWLLGAMIFYAAQQTGQVKPNNAFVLRSAEWAACAPDYLPPPGGPAVRVTRGRYDHQLDCFLDQPEAASYPAFNALIYSADTLLPIVAMEMQEYWLPDGAAGTWGKVARVYLWLHIAAGWALSLLAVAGFSGLIKTDNTT